MGIWRKTEQRALPLSIDPNQISARPYYPNYSGELVTEATAFGTSAVIAAVSILADSIAAMPLKMYRQRESRLEPARTPQVLIQPNKHQGMFEFVHEAIATMAIHGTVFIYSPIDDNGFPLELRNIHPNKVRVIVDDLGQKSYDINKQIFGDDEIVQINWMVMPNRHIGYSPLEMLRNTVGTLIAIDRFLSAFYGDGATPSSVLETDQQITSEQANILRNSWEDAHWKRRRPAVLTGGLKWKPITASASDMDTSNFREAVIRDIARAYRIPLHMMLVSGGEGSHQTYQNIESAGINFVRHTLLPWMRRLEDGLGKMFPYPIVLRFDADSLQRADRMTRVKSQQIQILSGVLSPNEVRAEEGLEPYEGGDSFYAPSQTPNIGTDPLPPERV